MEQYEYYVNGARVTEKIRGVTFFGPSSSACTTATGLHHFSFKCSAFGAKKLEILSPDTVRPEHVG